MLNNKQKILSLITIVIVIIIQLIVPRVTEAVNNIYYPYPIIFVHGINSSIATWNYTKGELEKYFKDQSSYKYFHDSKQDYFPDCDYGFMNNGDIRSIAWVLKASIDDAIKELPDGQKKVIIVAHSMGGLVVRSLLKQLPDYQSKIDRVVFIGTPHLGAPSASALWILKELNEATLDDIVTKYSKFYSASAFTGFRYKPINYSPSLFSSITSRLITLKTNIAMLLKLTKIKGPDPDGIALEELRLAGDVNYHTTIVDFSLFQFIREDISLGHLGNEAFLGQNYLNVHSNYKTVRGINNFTGKILAFGIDQLLDDFSNNFAFPVLNGELQSLENARNIGDGIVTKSSQEGIGSADYVVNAFHFDLPISRNEETEQYQTILQAIDDAPVIESAYFVKSYPTSYVVIKVKDYLLADIEIADMRVDGQAVDLNKFKDTITGTYKPYVKFGKDKEFLKEREVTLSGQKINFKPGEFYVPITSPSNYDAHAIYFKFKNPANKEAEACLYLPAERRITKYGYTCTGSRLGNKDDWVGIRQAAYNNFNHADKKIVNGAYGIRRNSYIGGRFYNPPHYTSDTGWYWEAYMDMTYSSWLNFDLNLSNKNIKQAKFIYNFYKDLKETGKDFNIFVLRDSSNTWPPAENSSGDTLLFELNTSTLPDFGQKKIDLQKTIDIPLEHINPLGYNVWQIKPNPALPEDNYIPTPIFYGDSAYADFSQEMKIPYYPSLFVTFE